MATVGRTMSAPTPQLQLETLFVLDSCGRIVGTREPHPSPGPAFMLIRSPAGIAWAIRAGIATEVAAALGELARNEPVCSGWDRPPHHEVQYRELLTGRVGWGPAFDFPPDLATPSGAEPITDEGMLQHHFPGWIAGEIEAGGAPVRAIVRDGRAVSACFCSRRSPVAAEAGLDTAPEFRRRGYAAIATSAWASAVRDSGRTPLYSTDWTNAASLAVARKLGLRIYATDWSLDQ